MKINLTAPINDRSYGIVSLNLLKELTLAGHEVTLFPIGEIQAPPDTHEFIREALGRQASYDALAPSVRIWHQHGLAEHVGKGLHVGFPIFELDNFNERETHHLCSQDRLLVCSHWAKGVVEKFVDKPVSVVPLGVDLNVFYPAKPDGIIMVDAAAPYTFLNVGKWEIRKGHDILCEAFNEAFSEHDNVRLQMMCHNPFLCGRDNHGNLTPGGNAEWADYYKNSKLGKKIEILPWVESQKDVARIMNLADCGVFPSRAEGWNLDLIEMMACGKLVIATDYSAHTEFCNDENSGLIKSDAREKAEDGKWFFGQGLWFSFGESEVKQLVKLMRRAYQSDGKDTMSSKDALKTAQKFTWANSAAKLIEALS